MLLDLIKQTRSIRRFDSSMSLDRETLVELVNYARFTPSTANKQPLRYVLSYRSETNSVIRSNTRWAGLLHNYDGPNEKENPVAYIIICSDKNVGASEAFSVDVGIAAQVIMMAARERGIGGCMIGSFDKSVLTEILDLPKDFDIRLILALGFPSEEIILEEIPADGLCAYYRDECNVHHVPKRKLDDVVFDLMLKD